MMPIKETQNKKTKEPPSMDEIIEEEVEKTMPTPEQTKEEYDEYVKREEEKINKEIDEELDAMQEDEINDPDMHELDSEYINNLKTLCKHYKCKYPAQQKIAIRNAVDRDAKRVEREW